MNTEHGSSNYTRPKRPGIGVATLVIHDNQLLLVQRKFHGAGQWSAPGGYLDLGETLDHAAIRETHEETGLDSGAVTFLCITNDLHADGKHNVTAWFVARPTVVSNLQVQHDELEDIRWYPLDRLPANLYLPLVNVLTGNGLPANAFQDWLSATDVGRLTLSGTTTSWPTDIQADKAMAVTPARGDRSMTDDLSTRNTFSMSNDNTIEGRREDLGSGGPITLVQKGMRVVDSTGKDLGKVDNLQMGDPSAATVDSASVNDENPLDEVARAVLIGGDRLPEGARDRLLREGYVFVNGKGWLFDKDYYVAAPQIERVDGDTVHLNVTADALFDS